MKNAKKIGNIAAIVGLSLVGVILLAVLVLNLTLVIKGNTKKDVPPDIFGIAPLTVASGSMAGNKPDSFNKGALIFIKLLDDEAKQTLKKDDVVCYRADGVFITHRIVSVNESDGKLTSVVTWGDANTGKDENPVTPDMIIGKCVGKVNGLGNFAMFLQKPVGIFVMVGIPVLLFIGYDALRIYRNNKKARGQTDNGQAEQLRSQEEEIRRLQALLEERQGVQGEVTPDAAQTAASRDDSAPDKENPAE